ncbi:hypothetical protein QBC40DRAFT_323705 [Triangularia verruculosa]|uniref:FHA domain-containing protein n=1 Tax=Triangularia verruculosa TaxID=2587418 RepID=A0AAN6XM39_9PEZI|nr:hypothetical protein QBC40DRAFT_323705 [Triangularia verruculosa]
MWLLESDLFEGKKLWLRPGKLYLFGRTVSEAGQLVISDKTISRKHITIKVEPVPKGGGRNITSRSQIVVEDLESKKGTTVNDVQIRGQKKVLTEDVNMIKLGMCQKALRILWYPVVLSFSFTSKELRADPWTKLHDDLEQLDIKYSAEYETTTTHVVSKKRNTSKGLQALINGKYIVTESFIKAIIDAATVPQDAEEGSSSALEQDFDREWPNALDHLPPRGEEAGERTSAAYAPNERRREVFEGYTFVFYEKKQFENLLAPITSGRGKAVLNAVTPGQTDIDDFIRYVKGVAGEKGLGSFEDGSEGKGVVVVRYIPKDENYEWYAQFLTSFAQRLDHRPIDQREFIEAILDCDASMLRRPLEEASQPESAMPHHEAHTEPGDRMELDRPANKSEAPQQAEQQKEPSPEPAPRRARTRRGVSRFKGFDIEDDNPEPTQEITPVQPNPPEPSQPAVEASQDSLFVSQHQDPLDRPEEVETFESRPPARATRKRPLSPLPEHDDSAFLADIAPTAAAAKRRRIQAGEPPVPPPPEPEPTVKDEDDDEMAVDSPQGKNKKGRVTKAKSKKTTPGEEILELARQKREEAEIRADAERRALTEQDDGEIDYAAIRRLQLENVQEVEVHFPERRAAASTGGGRTREQDIADGRWDPRWNGRRNYKQFRKQGVAGGRQAARKVILLEEVRVKSNGIGDEYWLENETSSNRVGNNSQRQSQQQQQQQQQQGGNPTPEGKTGTLPRRNILSIDSSEEDEDEGSDIVEEGWEEEEAFVPEPELELEPEPARSRAGKKAERANARRGKSQVQQGGGGGASQTQVSQSSSNKRAAPPMTNAASAAKRPRRGGGFAAAAGRDDDSEDDSDDELKFRFGRRK